MRCRPNLYTVSKCIWCMCISQEFLTHNLGIFGCIFTSFWYSNALKKSFYTLKVLLEYFAQTGANSLIGFTKETVTVYRL